MSPGARIRRSILFFPADRPDRFPKALSSGADAVCIDLEDAVAPDGKAAAREGAIAMLRDRPSGGAEVVLRVNSAGSLDGLRDLLAMNENDAPAPDAVMLPKLDSADELRRVEGLLPPSWSAALLLPMIETARGLAEAESIATATARIGGLVLGGIDLSTELGCSRDWESLLYARSRVVHAAALAEVEAIDLPYLDVTDPAGARAEAEAAARLGFGGKVLIHPSQVEPVHAAFTPDAERVASARRIVEAYRTHGGGVALLDGRLIERPVVRAAERTLAIAAAAETVDSGD